MPPPKRKVLTPKEKIFCAEYLKDFNATRACRVAGYSKKALAETGYDNLRKSHIQKALGNKAEELVTKSDVSVVWALDKYKTIVDSHLLDYFNDDGKLIITDLKKLPKKQTYCIKKLKETTKKYTDKNGEQHEETTTEIELMDRLKALSDIGKYLNMFAEKESEEDKKPRAINVSVKILEGDNKTKKLEADNGRGNQD